MRRMWVSEILIGISWIHSNYRERTLSWFGIGVMTGVDPGGEQAAHAPLSAKKIFEIYRVPWIF
jgi:hypothetical protein